MGVKVTPTSEIEFFEFATQGELDRFVNSIKHETPRVQFFWNEKAPELDELE